LGVNLKSSLMSKLGRIWWREVFGRLRQTTIKDDAKKKGGGERTSGFPRQNSL